MKRVSRACQQCRSKHIKCNGRSPCSRCIAHAELHNISPSDICLYPEPKKRGRPSTGTSTHHAHHHQHTSSSSVAKKRTNSMTNRGRISSSHSSTPTITTSTATTPTTTSSSSTRSNTCSAHSSPTHHNFINLQNPRWPKQSIVNQMEPTTTTASAVWNDPNVLYVVPQPLSYNNSQGAYPMEFYSHHSNIYSDLGSYYTAIQQQQAQPSPQPRVYSTSSSPSTSNLSSTSINSIPLGNHVIGYSNNYYRHYSSSNGNGRTYTSNCNTNNNSTTVPQSVNNSTNSTTTTSPNHNHSNHDNTSTHSHHYHLNRPYYNLQHRNHSAVSQADNTCNFNDPIYFNNSNNNNNNSNFSNEGSMSSDSSDSPDSSHTSTPELLPTLNATIPSVANSPLLSPEYPFYCGINNGLNIEPFLTHYDCILPSYQQDSELDSPLLSNNEFEIAYSTAPYTNNCIYPSMLDRNTSTFVKTEDRPPCDSQIPVNPATWSYN
jgi:hypothetical protein